jgi:conjugal transfer pilus assembly protein TraW
MKILILCIALIISSYQDALSKDFGVVGHVWDIAEEDILEYIEKKLRSVDVDKLKEEMRGKTREAVERPKQVSGVKDNLLQRIHYHDPSYVVPEDIYDHKGNLLYKAGYKVNPLNQVPLRERLIFINGDNEEQVKYALKKRKEYQGLAKIILTKGAPLEIQRREKVWMYFDQQGVLTVKLGIKAVPALVEQSGLRLKVTEVSKEEWGEK